MNKDVVVVFVEGETDEEFYSYLIDQIKNLLGGQLNCKYKIISVKGIGNFKKDVIRKFERTISKQYDQGTSFHVLLCYDTDAFEYNKNPPVNMGNLRQELITKGAKDVNYIKAEKSIEDWFLYDFNGILKYLKLNPKKCRNATGNSGYEKLNSLFKRANKTYIKGKKCEGFVKTLNILLIMSKICHEIKPLCKALGLNCDTEKSNCKM